MEKITTGTAGQRTASLIASGALAVSLMASPAMALAAEIDATAGAQTGSGSTEVTVQTVIGNQELGGSIDPGNPPIDPDDPTSPGKNIAFTVPSAINFVADAQGNLTGPSASSTYIENLSIFGIRATSFDVDAENGWSIIDDGSSATAANSVDFQFGPSDDKLDAFDYLEKARVSNPAAWNMAAATDEGVDDRVELNTSGNLFKVNKDITSQSKIATIKTYVRAGNVADTSQP